MSAPVSRPDSTDGKDEVESIPAAGPPPGPDAAAQAEAIAAEQESNQLVDPPDVRPDTRALLVQSLTRRPAVRAGVYAWSFIGLTIVAIALFLVIAELHGVVVPLVLALFPAAVLSPLVDRLRDRGVPSAGAATIVLLGTLAMVTGLVSYITPQVAEQFEPLQASIAEGYDELDAFLRQGPFGLQPVRLDVLIDRISGQLQEGEGTGEVAAGALGFAVGLFETATSTILMLIVLFFYLKDGRSIAAWVRSIFPARLHADVSVIGQMTWRTIGGYIQGQLLVAAVDAVFIGLGLWILGVELALPLAVIVFFGGLFPIVGATVAGFLAALVALSTDGVITAALVVAVVLGVQFIEGHFLLPLILGRTLSIHPMAIIISLAVGGFLLGILGAFLAVPVAAAGAQTVGYLRKRIPG